MPTESESESEGGNELGLVFRTNDVAKWGMGKGADLDAVEVDLNFWTLMEAVLEAMDSGLQPKEIYSITVTDNQMTILLDDLTTSFGPFTLPAAAFNWTDQFVGAHAYKRFDLFNDQAGMYLVLRDHTSDSEFDPERSDGGGAYYQLIFPYPRFYSIGFFFPGIPGTGIGTGNAMFSYRADQSFYLPEDLLGSVAGLEVATTDTFTCSILKNADVIGSVTVASGQTEATFSFADVVQFVAGDRLRVLRPTDLDETAGDFTITFAGVRGTFEEESESSE